MKKILLAFLLSSLYQITLGQNGITVTPPVTLLALGDSYTIGQGVPQLESWPFQLMDSITKRGMEARVPEVIAQTGWRTDNLLKAMDGYNFKPSYDMVAVLIGVNNQFQGRSTEDYARDLSFILDQAVELGRNGNGSVLMLSIPDYAFTLFGQDRDPEKISEEIDLFNQINNEIAQTYGITYIDITDVSRWGLDQPDLVASDDLHPSGKMYAIWVTRILKELNYVIAGFKIPANYQEDPTLKVFPNPFDLSLFITSARQLEANFILIDNTGRIIHRMELTQDMPQPSEIILEHLDLNAGTYRYLIFSDEYFIGTGTVVKSR